MPPTTVADVLRTLLANPGRPRLTWYGQLGERVELSSAVLENWVNKTTNLLVEELDASPGTRIRLDLPPHWRTLVWALAVWRSGACVVTDAGSSVDVTVTDSPERHPDTDQLVVVSLGALARRYGGDLPAGALDAASAVMTYADSLGWIPPLDPGAAALVGADVVVTHRDLVVATSAERTLLDVDGSAAEPSHLLEVLGILAADGSVVLVAGETALALRAEPERRSRLLASERITAER